MVGVQGTVVAGGGIPGHVAASELKVCVEASVEPQTFCLDVLGLK